MLLRLPCRGAGFETGSSRFECLPARNQCGNDGYNRGDLLHGVDGSVRLGRRWSADPIERYRGAGHRALTGAYRLPMLHYLALLERLDGVDGPPLSEHIYRVASPSLLDVDDSIVRLDPTDSFARALGTYRTPISLLRWMDPRPNGSPVESQAVASELGALLTFVTDRKVNVAATEITLRMQGSEFTEFMPAAINDTGLVGPIQVDVRKGVELTSRYLRGLSPDDAVAIGGAIDLHYAAVLLHDSDVNTASTLVVAGIETLVTRFGQAEPVWADYADGPRFDARFAELGLSEVQAEQLRLEILQGQHLRLQQRFVSYVLAGLKDKFWETKVEHFTPGLEMDPKGNSRFLGYTLADTRPIGNWVPQDRSLLKRRLAATYAARSRYVHAGSKSHNLGTALESATGLSTPSDQGKVPLAFAGLRRVLRELIFVEMDKRAKDTPLPEVRLVRNPAPDAHRPSM